MYSGNLGRAHEWRTLLDAQAILEKQGCPATLRFQGGGAATAAARACAGQLGLQHCEWLPYASTDKIRESLLAADVLIATQRPEAAGLVWPSKLALLVDLPRRILWIGKTDGAIARLLGQRSDNGVFAPGAAEAVAQWIAAACERGTTDIPPMESAAEIRRRLLSKWLELLDLPDENPIPSP
jgi:hypothetical protein